MRASRWLANLKGQWWWWLLLLVELLQITHQRVQSTALAPTQQQQQMQLGGKCALKGSCTRELTSRRLDLDSSVGSQKLACYCDQKCAQFDDCCQDARWTERLEARVELASSGELAARRHQWQCKRINPIFGDVLVRAACPPDWLKTARSSDLPQAELIKRRCESTDFTDSTADWIQSDPMGSLMPITDLLTGITYANSYCLRCNLNHLKQKNKETQTRKLIYWTPLVSCAYNPETDDRNDLYDLISSKRGQALKYSASKRSWFINTQALSVNVSRQPTSELGVSSRLKPTDEDATERACTMMPTVPDSIEHMIRHCKLNTIDWCPPEVPHHKLNVSGDDDQTMRRARHECQFGHQSLVYSQTSDAIYFNLACAKCHQEERLFCEPRVRKEFGVSRYALPGDPLEPELPPADLANGPHSRSGGQPATPISGSFTVLMDLYGGLDAGAGSRGEVHNNKGAGSGGSVGGEADDQLVGAVHQCEDAEWQVYDPILLTCRDIVCGLNHKFVDGSCVLIGSTGDHLGELHDHQEDNTNKTLEFNITSEPKVNASSSAPSRALDRPVAALEQVVAPSSLSNKTELGQQQQQQITTAAEANITTTTTTTSNDQETREIFARLKLDELPLASAKSRRSFAECAKILVSSEHYRLFTLAQLQQFKRDQVNDEQQQQVINKTNDVRSPLSLGGGGGGATQEPPPSWAFVLPYNLTLASSQFELVRAPSGGQQQFKLLVCSPFKSDLVDKFKAPMVYLTTCCLAISIASLVAYLLLYALSTFDLRHLVIEMTQAGQQHHQLANSMVDSKCRGSRASDQTSYNAVRSQSLSSRGVACLALALLAAYLLFILGHQQQQETDRKRQVEIPEVEETTTKPSSGPTSSCRLIAAATYCSFLLAFNWMFLLSYDIWRTLRLATCQMRAPVMSAQSRRFLVYAALAISSASAITLIALLIDQLEPLGIQSGACQPPTQPPPTWWAQKLDKFAQVYRPKFGQRAGSCWFANRRSLALFFGLPVTLIMFTNLMFFLHSSYMVIRTSLATTSTSSSNSSSTSSGGGGGGKTPSFLALFSNGGNSQVEDFALQNSLTTSSISSVRTIQSSLSIESAIINDNNNLNLTQEDDEPTPTPPPPRDGATSEKPLKNTHFEHASVGKQLSSNSLLSVSNQSDKSTASSLASSLAHKYDFHLNNLSAFMSSIGKDYRLYCRLSTIMGLTWLTGLMASIVDQSDALWYLFVLLNTLQGLFIFIAFGFKRSRLTNLEILINYTLFKLKRCRLWSAKDDANE